MRSGGDKTKEQLIDELAALRKQIADLEASETERKKAEEALRESERRYRLLAENAKDAIWTVDMNMRPTYMSPSITYLLGYSVEEAIAKPMEAVYTPASFEIAMKVLAEELAIENMEQKDLSRSRTVELELNRKDGSIVPVEGNFSFIRGPDGRPVRILAIVRDITERKKAEEALRESERRYRLLAENATDLIFTVDMNLNLTYVSPSVERFTGYSIEEVMNLPLSEAYTPASREVIIKAFMEELAIEKTRQNDLFRSRTLELEGRCKDGSTVWSELRMTFLRDPDGQAIGIVGVARDITERKRMEGRIAHLNQLLRASYNVSHLIARERDPDKLLKSACDTLIESRGYRHAWLVLLDAHGRVMATAEGGLGKDFFPLTKQLKCSELTICGKRALEQSEVVVTVDPLSSCADCPLANRYEGMSALTVRLEHNGKVYGLLSCSIPNDYATDEEELALFQTVAEDISFALHSVETEKQRQRAVNALVKLARTFYK